jgi:RNA polymerase sigma factor (TIGR02999 family)
MGSGDNASAAAARDVAVAATDAAELTRLLNEAGGDDGGAAAAALLPLVYDQLRRLARAKMRRERTDQTLSATALVHEAYLRLVDQTRAQAWGGRWHFFAAAAEAMRRILIDHARRRTRLKRGGGGRARVNLDRLELAANDADVADELLALDEALSLLNEKHPEKAKLGNLRYFGGLTGAEAAEALGVSTATADRHWSYAKAWLYREMSRGGGGGGGS